METTIERPKTVRADHRKTLQKTAKSMIMEPEIMTVEERAKATWIGKSTMQRNLQELGQKGSKDDTIVAITDSDISIVIAWQLEIDRRLKDRDELMKMRTVEISQVIKESTARYALFRGNATDENWWLQDLASIIAWIQWVQQ